jgi:hypothetical protein
VSISALFDTIGKRVGLFQAGFIMFEPMMKKSLNIEQFYKNIQTKKS